MIAASNWLVIPTVVEESLSLFVIRTETTERRGVEESLFIWKRILILETKESLEYLRMTHEIETITWRKQYFLDYIYKYVSVISKRTIQLKTILPSHFELPEKSRFFVP